METMYKLNARELTPDFITAIRSVYLDRDIKITISEVESSMNEDETDDEDDMDATEYLMQSPVNRMRISKAIENIERGENLIWFETLEQAIQYAEERACR